LSTDEEGRALLDQQKLMHKDKRQFVEYQRKLHEQFVREQKEFTALLNKVKSGGVSGGLVG
jgi:hypothetical protein